MAKASISEISLNIFVNMLRCKSLSNDFFYFESELDFLCRVSEVVALAAVGPGQEVFDQPDADVVAHFLKLAVHVVDVLVILETRDGF